MVMKRKISGVEAIDKAAYWLNESTAIATAQLNASSATKEAAFAEKRLSPPSASLPPRTKHIEKFPTHHVEDN